MNIAMAEVLVASPGRNFVTLRITTDDGLTGLGDATLNGRELAVEAYLREHVAPLLIGRDAERIEDTWQYLDRGPYWRRGPVPMAPGGPASACTTSGAAPAAPAASPTGTPRDATSRSCWTRYAPTSPRDSAPS